MIRDQLEAVLAFLNSIEGDGYGGMAVFEIARGYVHHAFQEASKPGPLLPRRLAADYITREHGMVCSREWLAKLAVSGDGPFFRKSGRQVYYDKADLDAWVLSRLGVAVTAAKDHPMHRSNSHL